MGRILALACALLKQIACKLYKKAVSTITSAKQILKYSNNQAIVLLLLPGLLLQPMLILLLLSSLQVAKAMKDVKKQMKVQFGAR